VLLDIYISSKVSLKYDETQGATVHAYKYYSAFALLYFTLGRSPPYLEALVKIL
jgi:hypothetical protein